MKGKEVSPVNDLLYKFFNYKLPVARKDKYSMSARRRELSSATWNHRGRLIFRNMQKKKEGLFTI